MTDTQGRRRNPKWLVATVLAILALCCVLGIIGIATTDITNR